MPDLLLQRLLNALPDAILVVDERTLIRAANGRAAALLSMPAGDLRGRSVLDFVAGDRATAMRFLQRCSGSGSATPVPLKLRSPDGEAAVRAHGAALRTDGETLIVLHCTPGRRASAVFRDLEERLRALHRELHHERGLQLELERALDERETLLLELHHRVRNNLQVISSLINLQLRELDSPAAQEALRSAQVRIQALALVHNELHEQGRLKEIDLADLLPRICRHLTAFYGMSGRVTCVTEIASCMLAIERASPLALLVTEAVTNALKHAFPGDRSGTITLTFPAAEGERLLRIADDGVGLPEGAEQAERGVVGWQLMRVLADQLNARLEIRSADGVEVLLGPLY